MKRNLVEALIGAAVLAVAAWFFTFTYKTTEFGTVQGYQLVAKFQRVDGLKVGNDVRLGGIKVGTVTSQAIDPETYQAVVKMNIEQSLKLPTDTSVSVSTEGLLGTAYLSLQPGGNEDYLQSGDQIEFTQGSVDIIDLIGRAIFSKSETDKK